MFTHKKFLVILSTLILAMGLLAGCGKTDGTGSGSDGQAGPDNPLASFPGLTLPYQVEPDTALVEYEGGTLSAKEFEDFLKTLNFLQPGQAQFFETASQEILQNFAREYTGTKILSGRVNDNQKAEATKQAEESFEMVKKQYLAVFNNDEKLFDKMLENQQLSKQTIIDQMMTINSSLYALKDGATEEQLKQYYDDSDKASFTIASVRHILISVTEERKLEDAKKLADELVERLRNGEDFAKLAAEYTDDPGSKETGGLYENAAVNDWVPEFRDAALSLPLNEISEPVQTDFGYHIMRVESRSVKSFDEVKEQLKNSNELIEYLYEKFLTDEVDKQVTKWNIPQVGEKK